jgi:hypothetical protein
MAMRLAAMIAEVFHIKIPLISFFQVSTVKGMAESLRDDPTFFLLLFGSCLLLFAPIPELFAAISLLPALKKAPLHGVTVPRALVPVPSAQDTGHRKWVLK